jgi:hypothetical protein
VRRRGKGRPFTKGDPRIRQLRPKEVQERDAAAAVGPAEEEPTLLGAMRHVFTRPQREDRTEQHRFCRTWMRENAHGFGSKLADLEAKFGKIKPTEAPGAGGAATPLDEGEMNLRELLTRIVAEARESVRPARLREAYEPEEQ